MENEPWMENELWMENEGRMVDLDIEPEMIDLLNNVASRIDCDNWMVVGVLLNIPCYELYNIKHKNSIICLLKVFELWKKSQCLPFTWATIVKVLLSPALRELALACELVHKIKKGTITQCCTPQSLLKSGLHIHVSINLGTRFNMH